MPPTTAETNRRPPLTLMQLVGLGVVLLTLVVVFDFNRRLAEADRLVAARNLAATDVTQLEREAAALQTQVAYATTDAAVIEWAHESGRMVQPGEVLVVPLVPTFEPTPEPTPAPPVAPPAPWRLWWELFFGPRAAAAP